ncbi:sirohydrochlorin chelatase [Streptomyces sp. 900105755]|uniref:sirohydrochlorin chelatase n=1 Tax=Streptomyces sp. 900105755 TaxID=3154389 RepID=UPI003319B6FA
MTVTDLSSRPGPPALVLVAHGSRDPRALSTVRALMDRVRARRPGLSVRLGHIELNEPLLPGTLAALGNTEAVLVPLLLGRGYHVKRDIPEMAAAARARIAAPLGPHPLLADTLHARLLEAGWRPRPASAVVLAAAGSRDPDARADTDRMAGLLAARLRVPVLAAYASAAAPSVPDAISALRAKGRHHIALASYFTAPGRFATESAAHAPWLASAPLGAHEAMADLVVHRYERALGTPVTAAA